ncbi:MAG: lysophospholipid acyltransferase family protein [Roseibacillus sp.]
MKRSLAPILRALTGVRLNNLNPTTDSHAPRIYYGNHSSHLDFLLVWAALPREIRERSRPVGAADYWNKTPLRRFLAHKVFRALLVDRGCFCRQENPLDAMSQALDEGDSLIIFPEGTRDAGDTLQDFKSGIYHLARRRPEVELVPVWLEGAFRILPKGEFLPLPLLATTTFGPSLKLTPSESKAPFLNRCRQSLLNLHEPTK